MESLPLKKKKMKTPIKAKLHVTALSAEDKKKIIYYYKEKKTLKFISSKMNITVRGVKELVEHYQKTGNYNVQKKLKNYFTLDVKREMASMIDEDGNISLPAIQSNLLAKGFGLISHERLYTEKKIYLRYGNHWFEMQAKAYHSLSKEVVDAIVNLKTEETGIELKFAVWDMLLEKGLCAYHSLPGFSAISKRRKQGLYR